MSKKQESEGESAEVSVIESLQAADVEVQLMDATDSAHQRQHDATRAMLQQIDQSNYLDDGKSLVDTWDRIVGFNDTNELVRVNIQQVQHMLQEAYDDHQHQKIADNVRLKKLFKEAKTNSKVADDYTAELYRVQQERKSERSQISVLASRITGLAKEYRSCAMQRVMFIHINMIQQFTVLITGSIQRHVKDPSDMRAILEDIKNAKHICFPAREQE